MSAKISLRADVDGGVKQHIANLRALAAKLSSAPDVFQVHFDVGKPAAASDLAKAEKKLGGKLPADLAELYTKHCSHLSFAWVVREGQAYRVRGDEDYRPNGQVDLHAPKNLLKWTKTDYAVVFGNGTGDGIALDLGAKAPKPFVTFDHEEGKGNGPSFKSVVDILADMIETAGMGASADDYLTPTLRKFLQGKGELVKARKEVPVKAPKAVAKKPATNVPDVIELTPHKAIVTTICAIDERRVATASYHEKNIIVRDAERRAPLGKLIGRGGVGLLFADAKQNVVASGKNGLERYDLATGTREVLERMNPHLSQVELERDGKVFALTTAFLERLTLVPDAPTKWLVEIDGSQFVRVDKNVVIVLGGTSRMFLTLARVELAGAKGSIKKRREWKIRSSFEPAAALLDGRLALALDDGSLAFADPKTLEPIGKVAEARCVIGPGLLVDEGRSWLVARFTDKAILDVYSTATAKRTKTFPVPGPRGAISAMTEVGGRLVVGDITGVLVSLSLSSLVG